MLIRNNNKYMNNPSLVFCDMPVRWWQISVIGIIIFISGIDAFFWTPMFIGLLIPIFGLLALSVGAIMIAFSLSMKEELVHQFPVFLPVHFPLSLPLSHSCSRVSLNPLSSSSWHFWQLSTASS